MSNRILEEDEKEFGSRRNYIDSQASLAKSNSMSHQNPSKIRHNVSVLNLSSEHYLE